MNETISYVVGWEDPLNGEHYSDEVHTLRGAKDCANELYKNGCKNIELYEVVKTYRIIPTADWYQK
ncbi:MAG: hypothetical protein IK038_02845 [Bacteroidaceae bacterium]|nr:hypothetical protein [Bacteroidaceae bacterium]